MNYRKGSIIRYNCNDGSTNIAKIISCEDNIKNGNSGFTGRVAIYRNFEWQELSENTWGYDSQIIELIKI